MNALGTCRTSPSLVLPYMTHRQGAWPSITVEQILSLVAFAKIDELIVFTKKNSL